MHIYAHILQGAHFLHTQVLIIWCGRNGQLQEGKQEDEVLNCLITALLAPLFPSIYLAA